MNDIVFETDLTIENGDFVIQESTEQHFSHLLIATKGSIKEFPTCGVGIINELNNENDVAILQEIQKQLELDGAKVVKINKQGSKIKINGYYG